MKIVTKIIIISVITAVIFIGFLRISLTGKTQDKKQLIKIGIAAWVTNKEYTRNIQGFKDGLAKKGFIEGENVMFFIETAEIDDTKQRKIIQSFIDRDVDLIYSLTTPGTLIAKEMVADKPIVFSIVTYPVEAGVINALENSGNNLVGTRNYVSVEQHYSQFEKLCPTVKKIAIIHRKGEPNSKIQTREFSQLLAPKSIEVVEIAAVDIKDLRLQLKQVIDDVDAIIATCDTLVQGGGEEIIIDFSLLYKKPSYTCNKDGVLKGALIGNIADFYTIGELSGNKAALILQGANPSSLLTESPAEGYLLVNTKTAKELRIKFPQYVLDQAQEIVSK